MSGSSSSDCAADWCNGRNSRTRWRSQISWGAVKTTMRGEYCLASANRGQHDNLGEQERRAMSLSRKQRLELREMFGGKCAYCGCELGPKWHADHIEPLGRIGKWVNVEGQRFTHRYVQTGQCCNPENDHEANFFPACPPCNINKSSCGLDLWRQCLERSVDGMRRDHASFRHAERFGLITVNPQRIVFYFETLQEPTA